MSTLVKALIGLAAPAFVRCRDPLLGAAREDPGRGLFSSQHQPGTARDCPGSGVRLQGGHRPIGLEPFPWHRASGSTSNAEQSARSPPRSTGPAGAARVMTTPPRWRHWSNTLPATHRSLRGLGWVSWRRRRSSSLSSSSASPVPRRRTSARRVSRPPPTRIGPVTRPSGGDSRASSARHGALSMRR